ncbi:MAG: S46 family peptidase [Hyphomonadaceae bacterium]|nr:S46 family peptidase [Hyphomonadaceae bacterium]
MRALCAALAVAAAITFPSAHAEEGMWTFDNFPVARVADQYGWAPDQAWLDRVRGRAVRLESGCSGAVVSADGLVLTNAHCVLDCVSGLSSAGRDYAANGFQARTRNEERRCEGLVANVLTDISDVSAQIDAATAGVDAGGFARARNAEIARLEAACVGDARDRTCQVVTLYRGGQYKLHTYKRYEDIRLVFTPEAASAFFGGDPDNFNFPRHCFDVAYLRFYEGGRPARTPDPLRMRTVPLREGELVFVAGNPGGTSRQSTAAQLEFQRDHFLPWRIDYLGDLRERLRAFSARGAEEARLVSEALLDVENAHKAMEGRRLALMAPHNFARVTRAEEQLQSRVRGNPVLQREAGAAWSEIAAAMTVYRDLFVRQQLLDGRAGGGSKLLYWARQIVRAAAERQKPDAERLFAYTDARLASTSRELLSDIPVSSALEELQLTFWLSKVREGLKDDPVARRMLRGDAPEEVARRLMRTRLGDADVRRRLWERGAGAVEDSDDPLIEFVRRWDGDARSLRTRYEREVEGPVARAQELIARARFQAYGSSLYPEATFSPRITYGRVQGWTEPDGRVVAPFTRIGGLYERATGAAPYLVARSWGAARTRLNANTIFNLASSNDIIGGNSGSALIDRDGRVAGVVFDGNMYSLGGEYFYDGSVNRAVSAASTAILEVLSTVYGMNALVAELRR